MTMVESYFQSLSLTGAQIGFIVGMAPLVTLISVPLITGLADRTNQHKIITSLSFLILIIVVTIFPFVKTFAFLFVLTILARIFFAPLMPLSSSATMFMLKDQKDLYGRVRLGGTIGFSIVAMLAGAMVESHGLKIAFWSGGALFFLAFLVSQALTHGEEVNEEENPEKKGSAGELLKNPHFLIFLLIGLSGGISFATLNSYFFPYVKELGAGESIMGIALTIGTMIEMPVLFFVNRFIKRFKAYALLVFSLAMTGLRFLLLAVAPNPTFVLFVQLLNGFNYPLLTVAAVTYADEHAPKGYRATAQGLFNAVTGGIGAAIGGFAGGLLFDNLGAKEMYMVFCLFTILVVLFVTLLNRRLPPQQEQAPAQQLVH